MVAIRPHSPLTSPSDFGPSNHSHGQPSSPFQTQTIRPGDTLTDLARRHDTTVQGLMEANPHIKDCLLYTSPSPRDATLSRMPSSA